MLTALLRFLFDTKEVLAFLSFSLDLSLSLSLFFKKGGIKKREKRGRKKNKHHISKRI